MLLMSYRPTTVRLMLVEPDATPATLYMPQLAPCDKFSVTVAILQTATHKLCVTCLVGIMIANTCSFVQHSHACHKCDCQQKYSIATHVINVTANKKTSRQQQTTKSTGANLQKELFVSHTGAARFTYTYTIANLQHHIQVLVDQMQYSIPCHMGQLVANLKQHVM